MSVINDILIFPNPFSNKITIRSINNENIINIKAQDLAGKMWINDNCLGPEITFELNELPSGLYLTEIRTESDVIRKKIIKL